MAHVKPGETALSTWNERSSPRQRKSMSSVRVSRSSSWARIPAWPHLRYCAGRVPCTSSAASSTIRRRLYLRTSLHASDRKSPALEKSSPASRARIYADSRRSHAPPDTLLPAPRVRARPRGVDHVARGAPPRRCPHAARLGAAVGGGGADGDPERSRVRYDSGHHFGWVYRRGGRREERALV